ncbi:hypothetical protein T8K17_10745 [Thalassobaculum sp. OXR-137]|uniref:hypothetical protein n=1 Tax=Thalassobaculum sp. OXR-137 TaxID=3100173 RepID=UPI002AC8C5D6|nr:hypothetical protein [Thalassobaculum sp. OXR-137]WPZ36612.1 hypothetical protein T8K17_10745 [Thalassobaculum sp. OXR-137]
MFSISKLVALAVIIGVIWFGFRLIGRLDAARKAKAAPEAGGGRADRGRPTGTHGRDDVVDLVRDERTGEYVTPDRRDERT